jgi:hypothetical protein
MNILHLDKRGPRLLYFLAKAEMPEAPDVSQETYDLLSAYEPRMYPPGAFEIWKTKILERHARDAHHASIGGLVLQKVGVDLDANETVAMVERSPLFVRWISEDDPLWYAR